MSQRQESLVALTDAELEGHINQTQQMVEELEQLESAKLTPEQEQERQRVYGEALDVHLALVLERLSRLLLHLKETVKECAARATLEHQLAEANQLVVEREQKEGEV